MFNQASLKLGLDKAVLHTMTQSVSKSSLDSKNANTISKVPQRCTWRVVCDVCDACEVDVA